MLFFINKWINKQFCDWLYYIITVIIADGGPLLLKEHAHTVYSILCQQCKDPDFCLLFITTIFTRFVARIFRVIECSWVHQLLWWLLEIPALLNWWIYNWFVIINRKFEYTQYRTVFHYRSNYCYCKNVYTLYTFCYHIHLCVCYQWDYWLKIKRI